MSLYDVRAALLVIDVQNDFADSQGNLHVHGAEDIVPVINEEIARAQADGALVVYTQDWHPERTPHFQTDGGAWPDHCVGDTWGAMFHSALRVVGQTVRKGTGGEDGYSGFSTRDPRSGNQRDTELESLLRAKRIERVVVVGLATDYCVRETALDATRRGFATTVLADAIRAVNLEPGDGRRAIGELQAAGVTIV